MGSGGGSEGHIVIFFKLSAGNTHFWQQLFFRENFPLLGNFLKMPKLKEENFKLKMEKYIIKSHFLILV